MTTPGEVIDRGGYKAKPREFRVAGVTIDDIKAMQGRTAPLGFSQAQWAVCVSELQRVLTAVGLDDADVRIKGSSTLFFAGPHKSFPQSEDELVAQGRRSNTSIPERGLRWNWEVWGYKGDSDLPSFHYFDSHWRLGIVSARSDYDIQLSSNRMAAQMNAYMRQHPGVEVVSDTGGHYKHKHVAIVFPELASWALDWTEGTGRLVNIASFHGAGPTEEESRFRDDDWIVIRRSGEG